MPIPRRPPGSETLAEELYRLIFRTRRKLWTAIARCLEGRDESVFTWQVCCNLVRNGPAMQLDLAAACAQDPAGMSRVLEEMEARRMVRRRVDPADRRRSLVEVAPPGEAWFREISPVVNRVMDQAMADLSQRQRRELLKLLGLLDGALDRPAAPAAKARAPRRRAGPRASTAAPTERAAVRAAAVRRAAGGARARSRKPG
jgi:DNA-binding MarR family transcriptional regulator